MAGFACVRSRAQAPTLFGRPPCCHPRADHDRIARRGEPADRRLGIPLRSKSQRDAAGFQKPNKRLDCLTDSDVLTYSAGWARPRGFAGRKRVYHSRRF